MAFFYHGARLTCEKNADSQADPRFSILIADAGSAPAAAAPRRPGTYDAGRPARRLASFVR